MRIKLSRSIYSNYNKVGAIKAIRNLSIGMGLKEAKEFIESAENMPQSLDLPGVAEDNVFLADLRASGFAVEVDHSIEASVKATIKHAIDIGDLSWATDLLAVLRKQKGH